MLLSLLRWPRIEKQKAKDRETQKTQKKPYNHFHNISRLFDVLLIFFFTTNETLHDFYL